MPGSATAEIIFIAAMMLIILIVSFTAVYFFFKTYAKEKRSRQAEKKESEIQNPQSKIV